MIFNLLTGVQDNYQSGADNTIAYAPIFSDAQLWIIGIVTFAVIISIFATIIAYCFYGLTEKPKKAIKYTIIIIGIAITITFIILCVTACKALN